MQECFPNWKTNILNHPFELGRLHFCSFGPELEGDWGYAPGSSQCSHSSCYFGECQCKRKLRWLFDIGHILQHTICYNIYTTHFHMPCPSVGLLFITVPSSLPWPHVQSALRISNTVKYYCFTDKVMKCWRSFLHLLSLDEPDSASSSCLWEAVAAWATPCRTDIWEELVSARFDRRCCLSKPKNRPWKEKRWRRLDQPPGIHWGPLQGEGERRSQSACCYILEMGTPLYCWGQWPQQYNAGGSVGEVVLQHGFSGCLLFNGLGGSWGRLCCSLATVNASYSMV